MNKTYMMIAALIIAGLLYSLAPILTPFLIGTLLAYLVNPLVQQLMRLRLSRLFAVLIVFLVVLFLGLLLIFWVVPIIQKQLITLFNQIPNMIAWVQNTIMPLLQEYFNVDFALDMNMLKQQLTENLGKAGGAAAWVVQAVLHSGARLLHWFMNLILIPVVVFYLLYDWNRIIASGQELLPRKYEVSIVALIKECNEVLGAFFRGQLLVMLTLGTYYSIALSIAGLQIGVVIGVVIGVLSIIPYLGIIIGILAASIAAAVQFGTFTALLPVWLVFAIGQTADGMFVTPKLVGDRIGLHPVAVIFAVLAGGTLGGFFGVLLALPMAAVSMVLLRFLKQRYYASGLYGE